MKSKYSQKYMGLQTIEKRDEVLKIIKKRFKLIDGKLCQLITNTDYYRIVNLDKIRTTIYTVTVTYRKIIEYLQTDIWPDLPVRHEKNKTGVTGVVYIRKTSATGNELIYWEANLTRNKKCIYRKLFKTKEEAIEARIKALDDYNKNLEKNT
jgi:hypothetical protein